MTIAIAAALAASVPAFAAAAVPPKASSGSATGVGPSTATLTGKVNPEGAVVTVCRFEYGTTAGYGASVPCAPSSLGTGSLNVPVSAEIDGLEPGTEFHFRLVASNANGGSLGGDVTFTTSGAPLCENSDRRVEQGIQAVLLPNCMALEQVSPGRKASQRAASPTIAAGGERVSFYSLAALAGTPGNLSTFTGDIYVADRSSVGWSLAPTAPPSPLIVGWDGGSNVARSFDPNLSRWIVMGSSNRDFNLGITRLYRGQLGGGFAPISPVLAPVDDNAHSKENVRESELQGASADHQRLFFAMGDTSALYLEDDPAPAGGGDGNVYLTKLNESNQPSLKLLTRDETGGDTGKAWGETCGARIGGIGGAGVGWRNQGAVSPTGSRVYFSTRPAQAAAVPCDQGTNKLRIMERTEASGTADISELITSECLRADPPLCSTVDGDDYFQGASVDGTKVYFTTSRQLTDSDLDGTAANCSGFVAVAGCDLYLLDRTAGKLIQVSAGEVATGHPVVGEGANVINGTVAISGDGSHAYFIATGVLTDAPNPLGDSAADYPAGDPKLYVWDTGSAELGFIGALSTTDVELWGGNGTFLNAAYPSPATGLDNLGNEIGGAGDTLVFQTNAGLTPLDTDGGWRDTFRFDGKANPPTLLCVSCRPGGPDSEPNDVAVRVVSEPDLPGTAIAEQGRWVSEDGDAIILRTDEALVQGDLNQARDDYMWRGGKLVLLPGTTPPPAGQALGETPPVVSRDGSEVAFTAYEALLPSDGDTAPDVYVSRIEGGFKTSVDRVNCNEEECQGPPAPGLPDGGLPSAYNVSKGNVRPPARQLNCPKGKKKVVRNGKARCVKKPKAKQGNRANAGDKRGTK